MKSTEKSEVSKDENGKAGILQNQRNIAAKDKRSGVRGPILVLIIALSLAFLIWGFFAVMDEGMRAYGGNRHGALSTPDFSLCSSV